MGAIFSRIASLPSKTTGLAAALCLGVGSLVLALRQRKEETFTKLRSSSFKLEEGQAEGVYDDWAAKYDEETAEVGFASPLACAQAAMKVIGNGSKLLDIGCGTGLLGKLCLDFDLTGSSMDGMDISMEMLNVLKQKGRTNIYKDIKKHDLSVVPWPFDSKAYDCSLCNGVLIYVEKPTILEEFVRVTKEGGHCCIMFRNDGYHVYEAYDKRLRAEGKWKLISQSEPAQNFPTSPQGSPSQSVKFSIYTYQVLV